ncbi:LytR/AlgR family response regulator transcription factor [Rugamonas sp. CCM 8940]|uniref:LytR/AlgR family response regulator transcription factor n=1 Tax=Rugamonas sp. CCM 8940 TaxID=2765359 RepID=UPI0018F3D387|nr:LytTR family transcriptional regulator DNA-binding domain-containing protein [Rugamonas sp. CCM 8940]MBJ7312666.1 response regulator [Rugamonas sp. CCM 8940]
MRLLIVDDERPARDKLRRMLALHPDVELVGEARDAVEALELIARLAPDAVLLDIQMPEVSGLELAASLPAPAPLLVFVTAYDQYAIPAFDANAVDYLLKPYDQERLGRALQRLRQRLALTPAPTEVALAGQALRQLLVSERGATRVVPVDDIDWLESADNYVVLHTAAGQPLLRQTLAGLVERLGERFVRCHRRAAVRLDRIASVHPLDKGDAELLLRDGARVPCSRQYRADIMARLQAPLPEN